MNQTRLRAASGRVTGRRRAKDADLNYTYADAAPPPGRAARAPLKLTERLPCPAN